MSFLDDIATAEVVEEKINILIFGQSGVGKTTFAGSGPNNGEKVLILSIEDGLRSIAKEGNKTQIKRINTWGEMLEAAEYIEQHPHQWDWVVIDSVSHMQEKLIWSDIVERGIARNPERKEYSTRQLQEYNEAKNMFMNILERFMSSDANIIMIALSEVSEDQEGDSYVHPNIAGQKGGLAQWLVSRCNLVGLLRFGKIADKQGKMRLVRQLEFKSRPGASIKDQTSLFSKPITQPTLAKLAEKLTAETPKTTQEDVENKKEA